MSRMVSVNEAAFILQRGEEQVLRYGRGFDKRLSVEKDTRGRVFFPRAEVEGLAWRQKGAGLLEIPVFGEFCSNIHDASGNLSPIENFFARDAGTILALMPEGFPYALALLLHLLRKGEDVILRGLETDGERCAPDLLRETRILVVAAISRTGVALIRAKEAVMMFAKAGNIEIMEMKTLVYDDFAKVADFWVQRRDYEEGYIQSTAMMPPAELS